jgi:hypothetical protein
MATGQQAGIGADPAAVTHPAGPDEGQLPRELINWCMVSRLLHVAQSIDSATNPHMSPLTSTLPITQFIRGTCIPSGALHPYLERPWSLHGSDETKPLVVCVRCASYVVLLVGRVVLVQVDETNPLRLLRIAGRYRMAFVQVDETNPLRLLRIAGRDRMASVQVDETNPLRLLRILRMARRNQLACNGVRRGCVRALANTAGRFSHWLHLPRAHPVDTGQAGFLSKTRGYRGAVLLRRHGVHPRV